MLHTQPLTKLYLPNTHPNAVSAPIVYLPDTFYMLDDESVTMQYLQEVFLNIAT